MNNTNDSVLDYYTRNIPEYYPTMYLDGYKPWQIMAAGTKDQQSIDELINAHQFQPKSIPQVINLKGQVTVNGRRI